MERHGALGYRRLGRELGRPRRATGAEGRHGCHRPSRCGPDDVVVTNGGKQAVFQAFAALVDPGDEVILPTPYWTTYPEVIALAGGRAVEVFAGADQDYKVTVDQFEAARTPRTKTLLMCSPSNPTGAVHTPTELAAIGRWALEHGIWVIK